MLNKKGFTLVELMISIAMTGIIVAAVYSVYTLQQKTHTAQDQVVEMQQNIRAATINLVRELRMAGYDPTSDADATITAATLTGITFTQDVTNAAATDTDGNGSIDHASETVTYGFAPADIGANGVVVHADGIAPLRRDGGGGLQPIAENIEAIEFLYTLEDGTQVTAPANPSDIRSVTISLLARAAWLDPDFFNDDVYTTASGFEWGSNGRVAAGAGLPFNDNYRRRVNITTVLCRNMGL